MPTPKTWRPWSTRARRNFGDNRKVVGFDPLVHARTAELQQANTLLAESNRQIMDSIAYATVIQRAVLPPAELLSAYFPAHFAIWQPRDGVGGDAYFAHAVEGTLVLAVVDCTGHGVPGALMTMSASALLQQHLANPRYRTDPAGLLLAIHASLQRLLCQDTRGEAVPAGMEMGLCCYTPAERQLVFAGAHIACWLHDGATLRELPGDRHSLGYGDLAAGAAFTNHVIPVEGPLRVYLTTDGWLDQSGAQTAGRGFGRVAFRQMLAAAAARPFAEHEAAFLDTLRTFQGEAAQRDDITLVGFTVTPAPVAPMTGGRQQ